MATFKLSRQAGLLQRLALATLILLCIVAAVAVVPRAAAFFTKAPARGTPPVTTSPSTAVDSQARFKDQDERIAAELKSSKEQIADQLTNFKERAQAQQSLISTLTTLTGLYVVILSLAAYARLQQTKEDSESSLKETKEKMDLSIADANQGMEKFREEVRADIPALHGINARLETLLSELDARLPVDGDWTSSATFRRLDDEQIQQAMIDEMVINSLDIFSLDKDASNRRTVSRLFVRLGQFYFSKASFLRQSEQQRLLPGAASAVRSAAEDDADSQASLRRAAIYFDRAIATDGTDPIALRARGVVPQHQAFWLKKDTAATAYEAKLLAESGKFLARSLKANPAEPGALFANAWLLANSAPPDIDGAIRSLELLISQAKKLRTDQRRKYLHSAHLNRANYIARTIAAKDPKSAMAELDQIATDLKEGKACAAKADRLDSYLADVRTEIKPDGDLKHVYDASSVLRDVIDNLASTP